RWNIRSQRLCNWWQGVSEFFETCFERHNLLNLALEVSNYVFWIHTWCDRDQLPAVFSPRVKNLLGGVSQDRSGCIFPFLHAPHHKQKRCGPCQLGTKWGAAHIPVAVNSCG